MGAVGRDIHLTERERQVLDRVIAGDNVKRIGASLTIAPATAQTHIKHIHEKTRTHSLAELFAWAIANRQDWDTDSGASESPGEPSLPVPAGENDTGPTESGSVR